MRKLKNKISHNAVHFSKETIQDSLIKAAKRNTSIVTDNNIDGITDSIENAKNNHVNVNELQEIRVESELQYKSRNLSLIRRQKTAKEMLRKRLMTKSSSNYRNMKSSSNIFGRRHLSRIESTSFRDRKLSFLNNDNDDTTNNDDTNDSDEEFNKWLYYRRTSKHIASRPTALFDMEATADLAATNLKIQQEIRRNQQKDKIMKRLEGRHGFDNSLLASSESDDDSMKVSKIGSNQTNDYNFSTSDNDDDDDDDDKDVAVITIRTVKKKKSKVRKSNKLSKKATRKATRKLKSKVLTTKIANPKNKKSLVNDISNNNDDDSEDLFDIVDSDDESNDGDVDGNNEENHDVDGGCLKVMVLMLFVRMEMVGDDKDDNDNMQCNQSCNVTVCHYCRP
jgi:hypothetical protein